MPTAGDDRGRGPARAWHRAPTPGTRVKLDQEESSHLVRVRRIAAGDAVVCFDGKGTNTLGVLQTADPRAAIIALEAPYPSRDPGVRLTIAASIPEPSRADALVADLAALGVARWVPLLCARTPAKRDALVGRREARWARAVREAAKVNGCAHCMQIGPVVAFADSLAQGGWLLDPDPAAPSLAALWDQAAAPMPYMRVGPEGGFTPAECERAQSAGVQTARLGAPVLRVGMAAVAAAAAVLHARPDASR